jgi:hypothetical protein
MMMLGTQAIYCLSVIASAFFLCCNGASAQTTILGDVYIDQRAADCPVAVVRSNSTVFVCCPRIFGGEKLTPDMIKGICGEGRNIAAPPLTNIQVKQRLYATIMGYVNRKMIERGRLANNPFRKAYAEASGPKALAVCINWENTTPYKINTGQKRNWQFITGDGTCGPKNQSEARQCVLNECQLHAKCDRSQVCTIVDVDHANAIDPPASWLRRHSSGTSP